MRLSLTTAETGYHVPTMDEFVRRQWSSPAPPPGSPQGTPPPPPKGPHPMGVSNEAVAHAIVRQSRWVVLCPWCPNAQYAHSTDRRFFCDDCGSVAVGGKWVKVEWPKKPEQIEASLVIRPNPHNRNWEWDESLGALAVENAEHGVSGLELP